MFKTRKRKLYHADKHTSPSNKAFLFSAFNNQLTQAGEKNVTRILEDSWANPNPVRTISD